MSITKEHNYKGILWKIIEKMGHETFILTYNKNFDFVSKDEKNKNNIKIKITLKNIEKI